jgi:hypothetical protein
MLDTALASNANETDELWHALARHLATRSTEADKNLLIRAASHPEAYPEPLCWGLQFIVRGDIAFENGSSITLDELASLCGLDPLPYIQDIPEDDPDLLKRLQEIADERRKVMSGWPLSFSRR